MTSVIKSIAFASIAALTIAACAAPAPSSSSAPKASASQSKGTLTAKGTFSGDNNHVVTGKAKVSQVDGQWVITLSDDFSLDGAPDPRVALGNGQYVEGTILGKLKTLNGAQSYVLPANLDIGDYNQVYIWCEKFSVSLGHANLELI